VELQRRAHDSTNSIPSDDDSSDPESLPNSSNGISGAKSARSFYLIGKWFASVGRAWDRHFPAWRGGIAAFMIVAILVLVLNVSLLIWTVNHLEHGLFATIKMSSCKSIGKWSALFQGFISISSTLLLSGSNYCIQVLSSPTREEVDEAHAAHTYLNIGVLSIRNITRFRKRRLGLVVVLVLTSIPFRLVYVTALNRMNTLTKIA